MRRGATVPAAGGGVKGEETGGAHPGGWLGLGLLKEAGGGRHSKGMRLWRLVMAGVAAAAPAAAQQQTFFHKQEIEGAVRFDYRWRDMGGEHGLQFSLPQDDVARGAAEFKAFDNAEAQARAYRAVEAEALQLSVKLGEPQHKIEVAPSANGYDIRGRGLDARQMEEVAGDLRVVRDQALDNYLTSAFYSKVDDTHIMPDHRRIARRYAVALAPFAAAVRAQTSAMDQRAVVNYLLHFFQTIPYDELKDRYTSNGAGFETPYGLLLNDKGDCDTKSVALAATLRALYPGLKLTMVYVPDHAFVGIGLPQGGKDYALRLGSDGVFVLADPTGPRLTDLGQVSDKALGPLNGGVFSYQEIPF
jgi:hypothetical protein